MDGAQFLDDRLLLLILALLVSVLLFITSSLVTAGTSGDHRSGKDTGKTNAALDQGLRERRWMIALVWIALVVGANLWLDIGLW